MADPKPDDKPDEDAQAADAWGRLQPHADKWFDARLDDFIDQNTPPDDQQGVDKKDGGTGAGAGSGTAGSGGAVGGTAKAAAKAPQGEGFSWGDFFFGKPSKTA